MSSNRRRPNSSARTCCWLVVVVGVAVAVVVVAAVAAGDDGVAAVVVVAVGGAAVGDVGGGVAESLTTVDAVAAWVTCAWSGSMARPGQRSLSDAAVVVVLGPAAVSAVAPAVVVWNIDWLTTWTAVGRCWTKRLSA